MGEEAKERKLRSNLQIKCGRQSFTLSLCPEWSNHVGIESFLLCHKKTIRLSIRLKKLSRLRGIPGAEEV